MQDWIPHTFDHISGVRIQGSCTSSNPKTIGFSAALLLEPATAKGQFQFCGFCHLRTIGAGKIAAPQWALCCVRCEGKSPVFRPSVSAYKAPRKVGLESTDVGIIEWPLRRHTLHRRMKSAAHARRCCVSIRCIGKRPDCPAKRSCNLSPLPLPLQRST